jgi:hypothetical protein
MKEKERETRSEAVPRSGSGYVGNKIDKNPNLFD